MLVTTYPCWDLSWSMLVKEDPVAIIHYLRLLQAITTTNSGEMISQNETCQQMIPQVNKHTRKANHF